MIGIGAKYMKKISRWAIPFRAYIVPMEVEGSVEMSILTKTHI
jgi:hypothetical protein